MSNFFFFKMGRPIRWSEKRWKCRLGFHKYNWEYENSLHNRQFGTRYHHCEYCYHFCEVHEDTWMYYDIKKALKEAGL